MILDSSNQCFGFWSAQLGRLFITQCAMLGTTAKAQELSWRTLLSFIFYALFSWQRLKSLLTPDPRSWRPNTAGLARLTPVSGLGDSTNDAMVWIRCVGLRRHTKAVVLEAPGTVHGSISEASGPALIHSAVFHKYSPLASFLPKPGQHGVCL